MNDGMLHKLREVSVEARIGELRKSSDKKVIEEWSRSGVKFSARSGKLEQVYYAAVKKLLDCIVPTGGEEPILHEGGIYLGCWLESTGTINAELLSRFIPSVSERTFESFAKNQREDGLIPYKVTEQGPSYRQIQLVTPLARSVWNHYKLNQPDKSFLQTMYDAMSSYDVWIAANRNTRGSGCVEAFSTFDTGHDLSPRFWHVPDTPHLGDASQFNPDSPILPFLAPDLTANMYCQRLYLARIAEELGHSGDEWLAKAKESLSSLFRHCFDQEDHFFYDLDRNDEWVRVQSDVLLRVMACEVGEREFFDVMLKRYLLNTSKFFAKYPFTSLAMDDPRFDPFSSYNSWGGPSNFLSLIRTPHAFEHHGRHVELTWIIYPILASFAKATRFSQAISPWTGDEGFTETYSPSILCLIDYVERLCGILPTPAGELWFTGLLPYDMDHGEELAGETGYSRIVDGVTFELVNTRLRCEIYKDGERCMSFPSGIRILTARDGSLKGIVGMSTRLVSGVVNYGDKELNFQIKGNEQQYYENHSFVKGTDIGIINPAYR
ncbi:hypothetical protein FHS16_003046 [Paenibacillus endophyticus]|uniref:Mannosylglycerate hydrolase MGH1-like glycoside hydrolase domain-containing protein n=1 Tax=Paenibacillus endophyticus TaxID=1294268 RepID=A0A7W5C8B1_9BACL|nr:hypothetical protein [Paenibacillus endophyticus]MBB3152987.1 hypothetical protein [Paenibacillus endophyticus]